MSFRGHADYIGINEDDTDYGTFQAPTDYILTPTIIAPVHTVSRIEEDAIRGLLSPHKSDLEWGYRFVSFTISGVLPIVSTDDAVLWLFKHFFGKVVLTGETPPYTHVFSLDVTNAPDVPTLGLSVAFGIGGTKRRKFSGCRVISIKLSSTVAGPLNFEVALVGIDGGQDDTIDSPTYGELATPPYKWRGGLGAYQFNSVAMDIVNWELTMAQAIDTGERAAGALGNDVPVQLLRTGHVTLVGKIDRRWGVDGVTDSILREAYEAAVDYPLQLKFEGPIIGAGPDKHTFQIDANIMIPPDKEPSRPKESQLIMESAEFEGRDDDTNRIIEVTVISSCETPATYP